MAEAKRVKLMRGAEASRLSVIPAQGEQIMSLEEQKLYLGDGSKAGGYVVNADSTIAIWPDQTDATKKHSLAWWITHFNGEEATLRIPKGTHEVLADITIPSNICLQFDRGALLEVAETKTLTINGAIEAGLYQIFDGAGTVSITPQTNTTLVEWYGAKGDGITDDADAINKALLNGGKDIKLQRRTYLITKTLTVPKDCAVVGSNGTIKADTENWTDVVNGASVPAKTLMWIQATTTGADKVDATNVPIKHLKFMTDSDSAAVYGLYTGLYLGMPNKLALDDVSNNDNCVHGHNFESLYVYKLGTGMVVADAWDCNFTNIEGSNCVYRTIEIKGQSVNCTFTNLKLYKSKQALAIVTDLYTVENIQRVSEGLTFKGGFIGDAQYDVAVADSGTALYIESGAAFYFEGLIIDLNAKHALINTGLAGNLYFNNCWFSSQDTTFDYPTIKFCNISAAENAGSWRGAVFSSCQIKGNAAHSISIGAYRRNITVMNADLAGKITVGDHSWNITVRDNWFNTSGEMITADATALVKTDNNRVSAWDNEAYSNPILEAVPQRMLGSRTAAIAFSKMRADTKDTALIGGVAVTDANDPPAPFCLFWCDTTTMNGFNGIGFIISLTSGAGIVQLGFGMLSAAPWTLNTYMRMKASGSWSAWKKTPIATDI